MSAKKSSPEKKAATTLIQKIGATASHLKDEIISGKDHLVEAAGDATQFIKASIHKLTHTGKPTKKAVKKSPKKAAKKTTKKIAVKKFAPVKRLQKPPGRNSYLIFYQV